MNYLDYVNTSKGLDLYLNDYGKDYKIEELDSSCRTNYYVKQKLSEDDVISLFNEISDDAKNSKYRVGITCDPDRREDEHDANFLAVIDCPSVDEANKLEEKADKYGFDAGKHVGNAYKPKSKKVYIYKKTPKTKEK